MLAATFISGGVDTLRNPAPKVAKAQPVAAKVARPLGLPEDTEQLVKINAAVQVGAGLLLGLGRLPRLSAVALAGSIIPTTLAGHRFWEETEPANRNQQRVHFMKNMGLLGGLILAAVDTEGKPSLAWRARRAARKAGETVSETYQSLPLP
jgi:putative oxidoreductase